MIIEAKFPRSTAIELYEDVESLSKTLDEIIDKKTFAVVLAETEEHLLDVYSIKHRLYKAPFLLVLPDREKDTLAMGYRLKPHAVCYVDSTEKEIKSALRNVVRSRQKRRNEFLEVALDYWRYPESSMPNYLPMDQAA
jgi:hypothetical protein